MYQSSFAATRGAKAKENCIEDNLRRVEESANAFVVPEPGNLLRISESSPSGPQHVAGERRIFVTSFPPPLIVVVLELV